MSYRLVIFFQRLYWQDADANLGAKLWFALRSIALGMVLVPLSLAALSGVWRVLHPPPDSGIRLGMTAHQLGCVKPGVYSRDTPKDRNGAWTLLRLPDREEELTRYTGELYRTDESTGWGFMNGWFIEMREGRVVGIRYEED